MIRLVIAAVWICAVTVGSILFAFQASGEKVADDGAAPFFGGLDYVNTGIISVPLIDDGSVHGYFLAQLVYTVEPEVLNRLSLPAEALLVDQVYTHLYANPEIDFTRKDTMDLDLFRNSIRDSINERIGEKLVHEILIEQIDYLSKGEIRDNTLRRRIEPDFAEPE